MPFTLRRGSADAAHALRHVLAFALAACLGACLTPPVIMPAVAVNLERALAQHPPGARVIELETEGGRTLRGVFVPAAEGAPVVLHLIGAAQSPASLAQPLDLATWDLVDLGYASLILDYGGVGASDGEVDVDALEDDAQRMWAEAVRLAGGEPERVLVRATSLGTIAIALAVRAGARPAALLLVAPVFPDTVVERFARDSYGVLAGWFAAVFYRPVARVDVLEQLERSGAPLCVTMFEGDTWTTARQRDALYELTATRTPHDWTVLGGDHMGGVLFTASLREGERDFLANLPQPQPAPHRSVSELHAEVGPQARAAWSANPRTADRLEQLAARFRSVPAEHLVAAALEHDDMERAGELVRILRFAAPPDSSFERLRALYSTAGSPRDELINTVVAFFFFGGDMIRRGSFQDDTSWDQAPMIASNVRPLTRAAPRVERRLSALKGTAEASATWQATPLAEATETDEEFRLTLARAALKSSGIADRLVSDGEGRLRLEWLDGETWRPLATEPGSPPPAN